MKKKKTFCCSFKPLCQKANENCDVNIAIDCAGYQSKKQQEKATLQVFFVLFTWPASPPSTYGTLRLPPMLLTTTIKKKLFAGIYVYSQADVFHACA